MQHWEKWRITKVISLGLLSLMLSVLAWYGLNEESVRAVVRNSARSSVILFLLAFSASSAHRLFRSDATAWLLRNRRYIGVSFAVSHLYHLLALLALAIWFPHPFLDNLDVVTIVGGGIAYLFIAAMAATSFDKSREWLGRKRWMILHSTGSYYLWIVFAQSYFPRAATDSFYIPFAIALLAVMLMRVASAIRRKSAREFGTESKTN